MRYRYGYMVGQNEIMSGSATNRAIARQDVISLQQQNPSNVFWIIDTKAKSGRPEKWRYMPLSGLFQIVRKAA